MYVFFLKWQRFKDIFLFFGVNKKLVYLSEDFIEFFLAVLVKG